MRHSEFKKRYDPKQGKYVKKRVYGEGISDFLKTVGRKSLEELQRKQLKLQQKKRP